MTRFDDVSSTRQGKCSQFRETWATARNGGSSAGVGPERLPNVLPLTICTWPPAASQSGCEQTAHTFTSPVQTLLSPFQQPIRECVFIVFCLHSGLTWPPSYKPSLSPTLSTPGIWLGTVLCGGDDRVFLVLLVIYQVPNTIPRNHSLLVEWQKQWLEEAFCSSSSRQ